jgi:hypothetical protein
MPSVACAKSAASPLTASLIVPSPPGKLPGFPQTKGFADDMWDRLATASCSRGAPYALTMRGYRGCFSQYETGPTEMHAGDTVPGSWPSSGCPGVYALGTTDVGTYGLTMGVYTRAGWLVKDGRSGRHHSAEGSPVAPRSSRVGNVRVIPCRFRALCTACLTAVAFVQPVGRLSTYGSSACAPTICWPGCGPGGP